MNESKDNKVGNGAVAASQLFWTLPYPRGISTNHLYRGFGRSRQRTPAYEAWRNQVIVTVRDGGVPTVGEAKLALILDVYVPDERRRDADNFVKATQDALAAALGIDDRQIAGLSVARWLDRENPRIEAELIAWGEWIPARTRQVARMERRNNS